MSRLTVTVVVSPDNAVAPRLVMIYKRKRVIQTSTTAAVAINQKFKEQKTKTI